MKKLPLLFSFLTLLILDLQAQKIVGYLPSYRDPSTSNIQYSKLNKIIYAFINPNTTGNLITTNVSNAAFDFNMTHFLTVKNNCNTYGVQLYISVGGADGANARSTRLYDVCGNSTYRATLISELVNFAVTHNLAGVDIDWEFPTTTTAKNRHELLLQELKAAIASSSNPNLRIGVAVGGEYTGNPNHMQYINSSAIQYIDDLHIMAYDFPASYGSNHSSLTDAQNSVSSWNTVMGVPLSKIYMGVPFYGRNSTRTQESEYNVFSASNPSGAYNSTTDLMSGYYYNAKATLETKTEWIINQGGQGIMIWDLGQDRTDQYSLLSAIYTKLNTLCPAPQPNLGPDVGFCSGSVTLNSNVATSGGRTFTWKKDGTTLVSNSASANTYDVSSGGTYTVEVTQSGCTKSDVIVVTAGSSLSATGGSRCGPGSVTLTVNTTGGTYDWYNASTGGSVVHTGQTYSPSISSTTTYYVQENTGSSTYNAGKAVIDVADAWNESGYESSNSLPRFAHKFTVNQDLMIQTVKVWTSNHTINGAKIMVISSVNGTSVVSQTSAINLPAGSSPHTITVNLSLTTGTYYIGIYAPVAGGAGVAGIWLEPNENYPSSQSGIYSMEGRCYANYGSGFNAAQTPTHYGQLFDWVISTGMAPACGRTPVVATVTPAANTSLTVSSVSPICANINGTVTVNSSESGVSYQPFIGVNTAGTAVNGTGGNINLSINSSSLSAGSNTITVKATKTGCGTVNLTNTASITVNDIPSQPGNFTTSSAMVNQGQSGVTYTVPSVSGVTYSWSYDGTGATINGTGNSVMIDFSNSATSGTLNVTASNSCGTSSSRDITISVNTSTSTLNFIQGSKLEIYPNPFNESSVIELNLSMGVEADLEVYDMMGLKVMSVFMNKFLSEGIHQFKLENLPSGTYLVRFTSKGYEKNIKVVKN